MTELCKRLPLIVAALDGVTLVPDFKSPWGIEYFRVPTKENLPWLWFFLQEDTIVFMDQREIIEKWADYIINGGPLK